MAITHGFNQVKQTGGVAERPSSTRFDWVVILLSATFITGIYVDGWAHNNIEGLFETFFTPYHALLYGGFTITALYLAWTQFQNIRQGAAWSEALPQGYRLALVGAAVFAFGGMADFAWHEIFGFEEDMEALLSPSHLVLAVGAFLMVSAPLRARWGRADGRITPGWANLFPSILSMTLMLSLFTFFTMYTHLSDTHTLIYQPGADNEYFYSVVSIYSILVPLTLAVGSLLFLMRRWRLPAGAVTFVVGVNYTAMFLMFQNDSFPTPMTWVAVIGTAVLGDVLYWLLTPTAERVPQLRLWSFLLPFLMAAVYMLTLLATDGLWWTIHMWAGVPFLAGVAGLFLSFLVAPMPLPASSEPVRMMGK